MNVILFQCHLELFCMSITNCHELYLTFHLTIQFRMIPFSLGGCENLVIHEDLGSIKSVEKYSISDSNETILCDDTSAIAYPAGNIFNLRKGKIIDRERHPPDLHMYNQRKQIYYKSLYLYKKSIFAFNLEMLAMTPSPNTPSFNVLFTQEEPHSWLDITIDITLSDKSLDQSPLLHLNEQIDIKNYSYTLKKLGSAADELIILKLKSTINNKVDIETNIRTTFDSPIFTSNGSPLYYPRELLWSSRLIMSQMYPEYRITLPGRPRQILITQYQKAITSLYVYWSHDKYNSHKSFTNEYQYFCKLKIYCFNTSMWTKGWKGKFQKDAVPDHCSPRTDAYKDVLGVTNFQSACPTVKKYSNLNPMFEWFQTSKPVHTASTCFIDTWCSNFSSNKNYFKKKQHYYINFYFHKETRANIAVNFWKSHGSRKSWVDASTLCHSAGGTLPILRSKEELDEIITLLRVGKGFSAVEFLFIGLAFNEKVGILFLLQFKTFSDTQYHM